MKILQCWGPSNSIAGIISFTMF